MSAHNHIRLTKHALHVLAHPMRARLLSELRRDGPANATVLAGRLATNTGATSYHLRKLAAVGLVEETDDGRGKQRWWRAAQESHGWADAEADADPDAQAAAAWLREHYFQEFAALLGRWEQRRPAWPAEWRDAAAQSDALLTLTAQDAAALMRELEDVVARYRATPPDPDAHQVSIYLHLVPTDPDRP